MKDYLLHHETLRSNRTLALFAGLTLLFLVLCWWRVSLKGWDGLAVTFLVFCVIFLFYVINYRTLIIRITPSFLQLKFGVFSWNVPMENISACAPDDDIPPLKKYGGAGIHFMFVRGRYRASWNFLEYPRLAVAFKRKVGPVQDLSFSTRQPDEILTVINGLITKRQETA